MFIYCWLWGLDSDDRDPKSRDYRCRCFIPRSGTRSAEITKEFESSKHNWDQVRQWIPNSSTLFWTLAAKACRLWTKDLESGKRICSFTCLKGSWMLLRRSQVSWRAMPPNPAIWRIGFIGFIFFVSLCLFHFLCSVVLIGLASLRITSSFSNFRFLSSIASGLWTSISVGLLSSMYCFGFVPACCMVHPLSRSACFRCFSERRLFWFYLAWLPRHCFFGSSAILSLNLCFFCFCFFLCAPFVFALVSVSFLSDRVVCKQNFFFIYKSLTLPSTTKKGSPHQKQATSRQKERPQSRQNPISSKWTLSIQCWVWLFLLFPRKGRQFRFRLACSPLLLFCIALICHSVTKTVRCTTPLWKIFFYIFCFGGLWSLSWGRLGRRRNFSYVFLSFVFRSLKNYHYRYWGAENSRKFSTSTGNNSWDFSGIF